MSSDKNNQTNADPKTTLSVHIKRPDRVEYTGIAKAVTSINMKGMFDVLPYHSNFISLIKDKLVIHVMDGEPISYRLQSGIIKVSENHVTVLIGIETQV